MVKNMNIFLKHGMNLKDYHDLYFKSDVLFLADVFEKFKNNTLEIYGFFPSHYLSAPALSWEGVLNMIFLIDIAKPTISI